MIPYFGPYIGAVPGIIILTVTGFKYGIIFAVMILALQQFDGLILGPRLLGDSTGLRPIIILFAITFGGAYAGVAGMFLGVPIVAVLQYLFSLVINRKLHEKNIVIEDLPQDDPPQESPLKTFFEKLQHLQKDSDEAAEKEESPEGPENKIE